MANIKINDLQPAEFAELSDLELETIVGGKFIKDLIEDVLEVGRVIDRTIRKNVPGGWTTVIGGVAGGKGGAIGNLIKKL